MKQACINNGFIKAVLRGFALICVCALALSAAAAALLLGGALAHEAAPAASCCAGALAVFAGAFLAARQSPRQKLPAALAAGGCYLLVCLLVRLLLPAGTAGQRTLVPMLLCIMCAALLAGILGSRAAAKPRRKRR